MKPVKPVKQTKRESDDHVCLHQSRVFTSTASFSELMFFPVNNLKTQEHHMCETIPLTVPNNMSITYVMSEDIDIKPKN